MRLLVTGGAGFIGSALVRLALARGHRVICLDALTYAASAASLDAVRGDPGFAFLRADIRDAAALAAIFAEHAPDAVMHLAAESHVDRSIDAPGTFVDTNVTGTFTLLQAARAHWEAAGRPGGFRLHHVSTDEVFGTLGPAGRFSEDSAYDPRSPYAATKAASDHLVRAWHATYGLPVVLSNCSNNYGPRQFPEKLVPVAILAALAGRDIPVYGDGLQVRDWLHVEDHAAALLAVLERGRTGARYMIGAGEERTNLALVRGICAAMDEARPQAAPHDRLIAHVADRPGHDRRYAADPARIRAELGWSAAIPLEEGLRRTVRWYLGNEAWWRPLLGRPGAGRRLGVA